jgi:hypothetical protein
MGENISPDWVNTKVLVVVVSGHCQSEILKLSTGSATIFHKIEHGTYN